MLGHALRRRMGKVDRVRSPLLPKQQAKDMDTGGKAKLTGLTARRWRADGEVWKIMLLGDKIEQPGDPIGRNHHVGPGDALRINPGRPKGRQRIHPGLQNYGW